MSAPEERDERDPVEALRALWSRLESPEPDAANADDEPAVEWMRRAWREIEPPPALVPWALRRRRVVRTVAAIAAAAALLIGALLGLGLLRDGDALRRDDAERTARGGATEIDVDRPEPTDVVPTPEPDAISCDVDDAGRVVMSTGNVTLVWLDAQDVRDRDEENSGADTFGVGTADDTNENEARTGPDELRAEEER
ncbi:MAG: hypothetical protein R3F34_20510 [Planctomycetota bacterium]